MEIKLRAWDDKQKHMAYQGELDLETLSSFVHHYGDKELMLCSNLKDHKGNLIYEKDFIQTQESHFHRGCKYIVEFHNGCFVCYWEMFTDVEQANKIDLHYVLNDLKGVLVGNSYE